MTINETPLDALIQAIGSRVQAPGDYPMPIPGLGFYRREQPASPVVCMVEPCIVLVAQGAKQLWAGGEGYPYDTSRFLVTSLDIPANSEVLVASPERPCLGLTFKLDLRILAELIAQSELPPARERSVLKGVGIGTVTQGMLASFARLVALLDEPEAIAVLAPLIQREIHYRLLKSDQASRLRQICSVDGQGYRIAKAIDWLKLNYDAALRVDELAARVQMSAATFHHHFRQLTAMSPLQYQKWLRLNEARRLMLNEHQDVSSAAFKVGYESPSQFSREYSRLFGMPPKRDVAALRGKATVSDQTP
ncbi:MULTISPECIES: AraC family transcriptional regulator [Pseudomonas fluorescens group]|uniref:AraC family transcriptional regulator n=1 Tax=Pseudomonas petroselini TaxID=2899822 RepID=A0ABS8R0U0_9PSED|nr:MULTISPECIES: AraC family transcriptional regulator [Pseudomonas fluorescens group]MCD7041493.1 AraC family transcriptional regulator [Pseudomonas petroselini]MCD7043201.1 AraC family transcriptional regulator [Pseudomonas petroselini]MCD7068237.1 AraC family transcriptional regulator [Pseudomonas petroselini]MCD7080350.1 AraC family transcriptional regulator [Pseudomonas petroselini]MCM2380305.1 AraC family transcriptional regulator [Pseudomonas marginalis]